MVISLSGYDGMGKSTSVDLLMEKICENHGLKGMSALKANNGTEVYEKLPIEKKARCRYEKQES